jgi:hypothetical protein
MYVPAYPSVMDYSAFLHPNTAIDDIFTDNYKFTKYTVSPIYNGLSDHDAQLLAIKDINLQIVNHRSYSIKT